MYNIILKELNIIKQDIILHEILKELNSTKKILKEKIYVKSPSEAPKDVKIETGERGGLYYESEGKISESQSNKDKILESLTDAENKALWKWTGDSYLSIAERHASGYISPALKSAINKMPNYEGFLQRFEHRKLDYNIGDTITLPALTSFAQFGSTLERSRGQYDKTKIIIQNGRGKELLISYRPEEKEIILDKNTKLKVIDVKEETKLPYGTNKEGIKQRIIYTQLIN